MKELNRRYYYGDIVKVNGIWRSYAPPQNPYARDMNYKQTLLLKTKELINNLSKKYDTIEMFGMLIFLMKKNMSVDIL